MIILVLVPMKTIYGIATVARQHVLVSNQHVRMLMHTTEGCRSVKMYKGHVFLSSTSE